MPLQMLEPDDLELHMCMHNAIPGCPFCGRRASLSTSINTEPRFGRGILYQGRIACTNHHCNCSMVHNTRNRRDAQEGVLTQWKTRVAAEPAKTGGA